MLFSKIQKKGGGLFVFEDFVSEPYAITMARRSSEAREVGEDIHGNTPRSAGSHLDSKRLGRRSNPTFTVGEGPRPIWQAAATMSRILRRFSSVRARRSRQCVYGSVASAATGKTISSFPRREPPKKNFSRPALRRLAAACFARLRWREAPAGGARRRRR